MKKVVQSKKSIQKLNLRLIRMDNFLEGTLDPTEIDMKDFGKFRQETQAAVRREKEDTLPIEWVFSILEKKAVCIF